MPQEKRRTQKKVIHARLPAQVAGSSVARISQWHRKAGAWKTQCQAEKTVTRRDATTKGQRQYANIGHMEPDFYMSVKHNIHKSKHNINKKFARMLPSQVERSKNSAVFPPYVEVVGNGRSKVRLARRRECRSGQRVADVLFLPHSGCRALVLDGTKCLQDCRPSRSYRKLRETMRVSVPELQRNNIKKVNQAEMAMVPMLMAI